MKRWGLLCIGVLLFAGITSAQDAPKVEVFGGYSYMHFSVGNGLPGSNFNGGSGSVSFNVNNWLGIVGDFGGYHTGSFVAGPSGSVITYLFGPKIAFRREKVTPFVQALFGGAHLSAGGTLNGFATALGGGFDYNATPHLGIRVIQAEYLLTKINFGGPFTSQNNVRVSAGVVFRF